MRPRIDYLKLTEDFNLLRGQLANKEFGAEQMYKMCHNIGISRHLYNNMIRMGFFGSRKEGVRNIYWFKDEPIYKDKMKNCCRTYASPKKEPVVPPTEESAINFLKSIGYKICKPVGFDTASLKEECPEVYEKYMRFDEI
jgi:hypothetical protein